MIVSLTNLLKQTAKEHRGLCAFNVFGYEDAKAVLQAAEDLNRPVVLMANRAAIAHLGVRTAATLLLDLADASFANVCIHLDHATDLSIIESAIQWGFSSVMFDGSQLSFEENVSLTRQVTSIAHEKGVSVEAEIGAVGYSDTSLPYVSRYTEPEEAVSFVNLTGVDALAVAIGTVHRMQTEGVPLQFDRLKEIHQAVPTPLVIHGSTGINHADFTRLIACGASKINLGTTLRMAFGQELKRQIISNPDVFDRMELFPSCMDAVRIKAAEKLQLI